MAKANGKCALVLEGGSFRGQFTAGVLDVLLEQGVTFDACWGVSAGALNGMNFKSRQIGRGNRVNLAFRDDKRYMSLSSLAKTGSVVGYDFLFDDIQRRIDPFDDEAYRANPMPFYAVVTDLLFGTADYLEVADPEHDMDMVRASTSLPLMAPPVEIGGHQYLDGGLADAAPVEHVLEEEGFDRAVVVLTRERGFEKAPYDASFLTAAQARYADYPYFVEVLKNRHLRYNEQRAHIRAYEEAGRALVVCPAGPVDVAQIEHSGEKLLALYVEGRREGTRMLDEIRAFIAR